MPSLQNYVTGYAYNVAGASLLRSEDEKPRYTKVRPYVRRYDTSSRAEDVTPRSYRSLSQYLGAVAGAGYIRKHIRLVIIRLVCATICSVVRLSSCSCKERV